MVDGICKNKSIFQIIRKQLITVTVNGWRFRHCRTLELGLKIIQPPIYVVLIVRRSDGNPTPF